jgi:phosphohistidine swiveling domain-containing protein
MKKNIYQKEFTRDFSIIMEEAWFYALTSGFKKYLSLNKSNIAPLMFYSHNGTIEVWSNGKIISTYLNKLNELVNKSPEIFAAILDDYEKQLKSLNIIFKSKHINSKKELDEFIKSIFKIIPPFAIMYYLAEDGLGNGKIINRARNLRQQDSFYEDCDNFLRRSLLFLYPKLKGLEALVTSSEIKTIPKLTILRSRYDGFVFIPGNFKETITIQKFSEQHSGFAFASPKIDFYNKTLKGISASSGKANGNVRVIFNKSEITSFKTGEILVAPMTTPDYISAMKKAKAFVTDEGGSLCHAAIIARELKKPCVIGTKIATQVLKTGDLVEVDAKSGIIKIINN